MPANENGGQHVPVVSLFFSFSRKAGLEKENTAFVRRLVSDLNVVCLWWRLRVLSAWGGVYAVGSLGCSQAPSLGCTRWEVRGEAPNQGLVRQLLNHRISQQLGAMVKVGV